MNAENPFANPPAEINPYAAPVSEPSAMTSGQFGSIWREGKILVMRKGAELPDVCIKSNQPAGGYRLKRKLAWHHPAVGLTILINILLYIIIAALVSKRATVMIGLSPQWRSIRRRRIIIGWGGAISCIVMLFVGISFASNPAKNPEVGTVLTILGIIGAIGFAIYGLISARLIWPKKVDDQFVYIKGAHPDFLDRFEASYARM